MISARLRSKRKVGAPRGKGGGAAHGMSSLIPMIDMLTILVVYLLVHAADYEVLPNTKSIQIPQSMSETKPRETVTVLITKEAMFVNGAEIASWVRTSTRRDAPDASTISVARRRPSSQGMPDRRTALSLHQAAASLPSTAATPTSHASVTNSSHVGRLARAVTSAAALTTLC